MSVNSEPVYYQLVSGEGYALSAQPLDPAGELVNATPDNTSELQLWELVVDLMSFEGDFLRVAMRNKYTGFVAAAPLGDNTWGVTQQGFDLDSAPPGQLWTFTAAGQVGQDWAIRPAGRQNQNLNARRAGLGGAVGIQDWGGGESQELWTAVRAPH